MVTCIFKGVLESKTFTDTNIVNCWYNFKEEYPNANWEIITVTVIDPNVINPNKAASKDYTFTDFYKKFIP